jgi:hypothetical protein
MEVIEGYGLVKLFAAILMKERWEVFETEKHLFLRL